MCGYANAVTVVFFATGNRHKVEEVKRILHPYGFEVVQLKTRKLEIQSDDLGEIASYAVSSLQTEKRPVFVEDAGLFIHALNGFPGPYSSYVYKTIGVRGILKLMEKVKDRRAYFLSAIALLDKRDNIYEFIGRVEGKIAHKARGSGGFGFDPIFVPEGSDLTFAEMSLDEKNKFSHRARAAEKLAIWLLNNI